MNVSGDGKSASTPINLDLRLSTEPKNELQIRASGVGYWESAPPNLVNIYVHPSGNDSADGSHASPLKNLQTALKKIADSPGTFGTHYIWIKSGTTHKIDESIDLGQKSIWMYVYDEPKYGTSIKGNQCPNYIPSVAADFDRINIIFGWYKHPELQLAFRAELRARGIYFNASHVRYIANDLNVPEYESGWLPADGTDIVSYTGCVVYKHHVTTYIGGGVGSRITTFNLNIVDYVGGFLTFSSANWFNWDPPVVTCPGMPTYELSPKNVLTYVNYTNISSQTTFDLQHRKAYGITQNWNVFP